MNKVINGWWLLPVVTLSMGIVLAVTTQPLNNDIAVHQPIKDDAIKALTITQVALPPKPVVYQPTLTATITNNRVVVEKQQRKVTTSTTEAMKTHASNSDALGPLNASQSKLAQQFSQVMQDMANEKTQPKPAVKLHAQALTLYPQWYQDLVPELEFSSHIYASDGNDRWVKVNNQVVKEGELINSTMRLVKIEPQQVIIEMQQRHFSLPALSNW